MLEPSSAGHRPRVAGNPHPGNDGDRGRSRWQVDERLMQEAAGERVVGETRDTEQAIPGAPIALGDAEGQQGLGAGMAGEGEEMGAGQREQPREGTFLSEGRPMGDEERAEGREQGRPRWRDTGGDSRVCQGTDLLR